MYQPQQLSKGQSWTPAGMAPAASRTIRPSQRRQPRWWSEMPPPSSRSQRLMKLVTDATGDADPPIPPYRLEPRRVRRQERQAQGPPSGARNAKRTSKEGLQDKDPFVFTGEEEVQLSSYAEYQGQRRTVSINKVGAYDNQIKTRESDSVSSSAHPSTRLAPSVPNFLHNPARLRISSTTTNAQSFCEELPVAAPPKDDTRGSELILDAEDDDVIVIPLNDPVQEVIAPRFNKATKRLFCDSSEDERRREGLHGVKNRTAVVPSNYGAKKRRITHGDSGVSLGMVPPEVTPPALDGQRAAKLLKKSKPNARHTVVKSRRSLPFSKADVIAGPTPSALPQQAQLPASSTSPQAQGNFDSAPHNESGGNPPEPTRAQQLKLPAKSISLQAEGNLESTTHNGDAAVGDCFSTKSLVNITQHTTPSIDTTGDALFLNPSSPGPSNTDVIVGVPRTAQDELFMDTDFEGEEQDDAALRDILSSRLISEDQRDILVTSVDEPVQGMIVLARCDDEVITQNDPTSFPVGRKRRQRPSSWKAAEAKRANNLGQEHVSLRGNFVKAKDIRGGCSNSCRQSCNDKISLEARKEHNQMFWRLGDKVLQWLHISRLVQVVEIEDKNRKRRVEEGESPWRRNSYVYNLYNESKTQVPVCQTMFLNTLAISISVVKNALKKQSPDKRGKHGTRRKMSSVLICSVINHIKSFPMVESHYCRASTNRRYLDENLNVSKMHRFYLMIHPSSNPDSAKLRQYRDIFNMYFNLGFFKPKKDQCFTCVAWNDLSAEEKQVRRVQGEKYQAHVQSKITARNMKKEDKAKTRMPDSRTRAVCYDLQKVCFLPKSEIGELFYKCKVACYNFTMYDMTQRKGSCYVWDQTVAGRGADEMPSFVYHYIENAAADGVVELIFWSDSCTAQNKNQFLYTMYYMACIKFQVRIVHRYLEKGHTQMEADSVHARIERKIKHEAIFTPQQWYGHIKSAKVKQPRYEVVEVTQDLVVSFRDLSDNLFQWKKVPISKIKEVVFDFTKPGEVLYKLDLNKEGTVSQILKSKPGRPINLTTYEPHRAYDGPIAMKGKLREHLTWMLEKDYIPERHKADFRKLLTTEVTDPDEDDDVPAELVPNVDQMDRLFIEPNNESDIDDDLEDNDAIAANAESASEMSDNSDDE